MLAALPETTALTIVMMAATEISGKTVKLFSTATGKNRLMANPKTIGRRMTCTMDLTYQKNQPASIVLPAKAEAAVS